MRKLGSIQTLRALAAMAVALFHACQWSHVDFGIGAAGVDVFFVISGFVLWLAAERTPTGPGVFLLARARRVVPLYWIVTLAVFALASWKPPALPIVTPQAGHLLLSLAFIPHNDPMGGPWPLLPSGWTLTYEAFFYLAFALALAAPRDRRFQILAGILAAASLLGFGYHSWYTLLCNPLLLEFLAGAALARLWVKGRIATWPRWAGWPQIALGVLILAGLQLGGLEDDFWRPFWWGPSAVMIVAGTLTLQAGGAFPRWRALESLGDASYSLYLVQAPLIAAFAWLTPDWPGAVRIPAAFALAMAGGVACYAGIERPISLALGRHDREANRRGGLRLGPTEQKPLAAIDPDLA